MWPSVGTSSPAIMFRVVVLPQPDGPSRISSSLSRTSSDRSSTTAVVPKRRVTCSSRTVAMVVPRSPSLAPRRGYAFFFVYFAWSLSQFARSSLVASTGFLVPFSSTSLLIMSCMTASHSWYQGALSTLGASARFRPSNSHWYSCSASGGDIPLIIAALPPRAPLIAGEGGPRVALSPPLLFGLFSP